MIGLRLDAEDDKGGLGSKLTKPRFRAARDFPATAARPIVFGWVENWRACAGADVKATVATHLRSSAIIA